MDASRYLAPSLAASVLLHVLVVGLVLLSSGPALRPALEVIPVALVGVAGGGDGSGGEPAAGPPAAPAADVVRPEEPAPVPVPAARVSVPAPKKPRPAVARAPERATPPPAAAEVARAGGEGGVGGGGGGAGGGAGAGDGSGGARVAYGTNPLPPYPLAARRLGKEGVVVLEVVVAADGHAAAVRVLKSSGFTPLDESAAKTVRERWRFVPARRGTVPVESSVEVPIRFRLEDARG